MLGQRIKLFKLLGFEVRVDASWLILAALIVWTLARGFFPSQYPGLQQAAYWWMAAGGAFGLFLSIVVHEFAHSLVARRYGIAMKGITLFIFGGVAEMDEEPPSANAEFKMAIIGPITSAALAVAFYAMYRLFATPGVVTPLNAVLLYLALINALLAGFNMVPAFPLDGGRVLRAFLWKRTKDIRRATRTAARIGSGFGTALIVLGAIQFLLGNLIGGVWWFLIGMFLRGASQTSYRELQIRRALEGESVSRFMKGNPIAVPPRISLEEMVNDYVYRHYHDMYPALDGDRLLGCVSVKQLKEVPRSEWAMHAVEELIQPCSQHNTIPPNMDAVKALSLMSKTGNSRFLVAEGDRLLGIVTLKDLLAFLSLKLDLEGDETNDSMLGRSE